MEGVKRSCCCCGVDVWAALMKFHIWVHIILSRPPFLILSRFILPIATQLFQEKYSGRNLQSVDGKLEGRLRCCSRCCLNPPNGDQILPFCHCGNSLMFMRKLSMRNRSIAAPFQQSIFYSCPWKMHNIFHVTYHHHPHVSTLFTNFFPLLILLSFPSIPSPTANILWFIVLKNMPYNPPNKLRGFFHKYSHRSLNHSPQRQFIIGKQKEKCCGGESCTESWLVVVTWRELVGAGMENKALMVLGRRRWEGGIQILEVVDAVAIYGTFYLNDLGRDEKERVVCWPHRGSCLWEDPNGFHIYITQWSKWEWKGQREREGVRVWESKMWEESGKTEYVSSPPCVRKGFDPVHVVFNTLLVPSAE